MEFTIAALRQLPRRSLRFDVLRERALEMLGSSSVQATVPLLPKPIANRGRKKFAPCLLEAFAMMEDQDPYPGFESKPYATKRGLGQRLQSVLSNHK